MEADTELELSKAMKKHYVRIRIEELELIRNSIPECRGNMAMLLKALEARITNLKERSE